MYLLDTNAIIYFVQDDPQATMRLRPILARDIPLCIATITEAELFAFARLSNEESGRIQDLLATVTPIPLDSNIARSAGLLRATYRTPLADSVIAATALAVGATVLTRNVADFKRIPELKVRKV